MSVSTNTVQCEDGTTYVFAMQQDVSPLYGFGPDESWAYVDRAGHRHTYDHGYPTLTVRAEHVPCPDPEGCGCDGYEDAWYECAACGERIRPTQKPKTYYMVGGEYYTIDGVPASAEEFRRRLDEAMAAAQAPREEEPR